MLITGASGGIGLATARAFAAEGCRLVLHYHRNRQPLDELAVQLATAPAVIAADLRDEDQTQRLFDGALDAFARIDTLVVNAGIWPADFTPVHEMSLAASCPCSAATGRNLNGGHTYTASAYRSSIT